ncbi:hypothetical protein LDENG_00086080 [Lucifuga dentata]|nr:hypothetical protein LDENG_00086080 [Lucifuga dentata]
MAKSRKCILCETVYLSKQEMDEHLRSMLHHRELEKLKGRDCGHECKVCEVTVVNLTDYAGHISSPLHKQNVEAEKLKNAGKDHDEFYFDKELVDLIERRKERIRREEEAAAAKKAKEEEERRKQQEFQQRLKEAKERFRLDYSWQHSPHGSNRQGTWYGSNKYGVKSGQDTMDSRPWQQGKSATWHAQEPPNFQRWESGNLGGGGFHSQEGWGNTQWDQGAFYGKQGGRHPWLSNGGSSNGIYGRNNISQYPKRGKSTGFFGSFPRHPPPPSFSGHTADKFQNKSNSQWSNGGQQGARHQNGQGRNAEYDHNSSNSFGSSQKLDKTCRWSPYPITKISDFAAHKDAYPSSTEKFSTVPATLNQEKAPNVSSLNRKSQPEQKPASVTSNGQSFEAVKRHSTSTSSERSSSSSRSSSAQRDGLHNTSPGTSSQNPNKPHKHKKLSSGDLNIRAQLKKASSQEHELSKSTSKRSGLGSKSSSIGPLQSRQEQQIPEILKQAKEMLLNKRSSLDRFSSNNRVETALHITEGNQVGVNKENSCRHNAVKSALSESIRPLYEEKAKPALPSLDSSQFLQSVHVSTSTMEKSEPAASVEKDKEDRKRVEKESAAPGEAMQVAEAGQSSESDASRSGEAQTTSASNASSLSKLDLPSALKRDLTKHISSKSKPGSHEPNLNIARRVRNLNESRKSEADKESGIKPTVRQLISSSGSRRNVNWEQVYQEVRKKQEQGKGMPRFGIEMVSYDQEEQSQEDDDIPLLEGFQWESVMDSTDSGTSRKRSLSESSLAPDRSASAHSLFSSHISKETADRIGLSPSGILNSEQQGSSLSPNNTSTHGTRDNQHQVKVEQMLGQCEAKAQKQPDKMSGTMKGLQQSDSVLGESSSGMELYDGQGTGKKRRAAGEVPSPESACLERKTKRRKIKSKRDRLQIDQLLSVSLREEELSRSLQTVDDSLNQARAALQAAYMEVQRLMVVKQQMTAEMSTLRNKRIELLKEMQGGVEEAPHLSMKEEKMDTESHTTSSAPSSVRETAAAPGASQPDHGASSPSSSLPSMPVVIKQEPQSPVHVSSEPDPLEDMIHCAHSTTPELHVASTATSRSGNQQPSPERRSELHDANREHVWENVESKESLSGVVQAVERALQVTRDTLTPSSDTKISSRRSSEVGSLPDGAASQSFESPSVPALPASPTELRNGKRVRKLKKRRVPASPTELRNGKRVRKLKKRRVLKKAQGTEQPESSDTELDGEASRPKWTRTRRRPSGGSQISTSTLQTAVEDEEGDVGLERDREGSEEASGPLRPTIKCEEEDTALLKVPAELRSFDRAGPEESMEVSVEVSAACQQPYVDSQVQVSESYKSEPQTVACNEVTSTSDMDIYVSPAIKSYESDAQMILTVPKILKTSSDVSSDPGEDAVPTEGAFEGHQEAVNAMQIHNGLLYTCSGDRTVKAFDLVTHKCVTVFEGHSSKVNCLLVSAAPSLHHRLYSGSSDQTIRCYSLRTQEFEQQFSLSDRVLCLHSRWKVLYAGLANGTVVTFNLKTNKQTDVFECHGPRAVSCLASSQEGARRILLVGSYDSTISVRDAKSGLLLRTLEGHAKTVLCLRVVSDLVFSGSSDQTVHAHNIHTGELVRVYKGHSHGVTVVAVLGKVMVTACLDKLVRIYELQSHEQVQVYGGHKDMVMCMTVHKSMIYTGCYDGSVQAVKLNLMQNYHCGTLKCRWKNCEEFFGACNSAKQGMLVHMQKHTEEVTQLEP